MRRVDPLVAQLGRSLAQPLPGLLLIERDFGCGFQSKVAVLRSFVLNHLIHHRAQLGVYLRINDVAVPSLYGPSADETWPGS